MRKRHTPAFKAKIVQEALLEEKTITQIAADNQIHPNRISAWKATVINGMPTLFERESKVQKDQAAFAAERESKVQKDQAAFAAEREELFAQIGRLTTQVTW